MEAAAIWTASKVFQFSWSHTLTVCLGHAESMDRQVLQYITEVHISSTLFCGDVEDMKRNLPKLVRVSVPLHPQDIELTDSHGHDKFAWEDDFTDAELASQ